MRNFRITFDKPDATYQAGETVTGKVVFDLTSSTAVRVIKLKAYGKAKIHCGPHGMRYYEDYPHYYMACNFHRPPSQPIRLGGNQAIHASEDYHIVSKQLFGSETNNEDTALTAGHHVYPFTFQLPLNLPCNFYLKNRLGHIWYTVEAILIRPWSFNRKVKSPFKITTPDYTSSRLGLNSSISEDYQHQFVYCCCCSDGVMRINVTSGRRSRFIPGATIELIVNYDVTSSFVYITQMRLKLNMLVRFSASFLSRNYEQVESIVLTKAVESRYFGKTGVISLKITVPPGPFPRLQHCSLLSIDYYLILCIRVSGSWEAISI